MTAVSANEKLVFSAMLEPHRSATKRNLNTAVLVFALGSCPFCIMFLVMGAWPVVGFVGVDVIVLFAFLRFHHWAARAHETVRLTEESLVVERVNYWGQKRKWSFSPHWLQVNVEEVDSKRNRLEIRNRDQSLIIGSFLTTEEKIDLADALRHKLQNLGNPVYA